LSEQPENPNSLPDSALIPPSEALTVPSGDLGQSALPLAPKTPRDPAWTGWDVLAIVMLGTLSFFVLLFLLVLSFPGVNLQDKANKVASRPDLAIGLQVVVYLIVLACMYVVVAARTGGDRFWKSIHWNWPARLWPYVLGGLALQAVVLTMEQFFPLPKNTPFDALLKNPNTLAMIAGFSVTLGPLMEELFFRGFLYPVLARRVGMMAAIAITALGFAGVHAPQYGNSLTLISLLFLVGLVIGWVRATRNSVGAGMLVHVGYNGVIVLALIAAQAAQHWGKLKP
jgi:membrane protease YdiL (CAAX protease family)